LVNLICQPVEGIGVSKDACSNNVALLGQDHLPSAASKGRL
jgi:hypothetical protein